MAAKIKCPYTFPHRSREEKVKYICGIGGYYSRDGRYPIEFNVSLYLADLSFENLWEKYRKEFGMSLPDEDVAGYKKVAEAVFKDIGAYLWDWAQETCVRDINKEDGDTYFMLWDGAKIDADLGLHGRCGKHLVIERFRSLRLRGFSDDELQDTLMSQSNGYVERCDTGRLQKDYEWAYSTEFIDTLYRYVRQCEVDFTPEKASSSLEYYAADSFYNRVYDAYTEYLETKASHEAVVGCAIRVRQAVECDHGEHSHLPRDTELDRAFAILCRAAGVSEEELNG